MKKVLNITQHKDGSYSLNNLTYGQMQAVNSALVTYEQHLSEIKSRKISEGHDLNPLAQFFLDFSVDASNQLADVL